MATYKEIQIWIKENKGIIVQTCHIAHVKEICGIPMREASNRNGNERKKPCPMDKIEIIKEAFIHFGMI